MTNIFKDALDALEYLQNYYGCNYTDHEFKEFETIREALEIAAKD